MQLTTNTRPFIEAEVYSDFILTNLNDNLLSEAFYRTVGDFTKGDTLHIKTIGSVTLQEAAEDEPLIYNPIESGEITFKITEYKGDAWYVTDDLREDGSQVDELMAARATESTRAIQETFESDGLKAAASVFDANNSDFQVNGFAHKKIAEGGTNNLISEDDFIAMSLAFDKANVPDAGRVAILDPITAATLNGRVTITHDVTPFGAAIIEKGMAQGKRWAGQIFGWDILVSNRLPIVGSVSTDGGTTTLSNARANLFMNLLDDNTKPLMNAWRRLPKVEGERNKDRARDEFVTRCRYGWGVQRMDTLGVVYTNATAYK